MVAKKQPSPTVDREMVLAVGRRSRSSSSLGGAHDGATASGEQLRWSSRRGGGPVARAELTAGRRPRASSSGSAHGGATASGKQLGQSSRWGGSLGRAARAELTVGWRPSSSGRACGGAAAQSSSWQSTRGGLGREHEQLLRECSSCPISGSSEACNGEWVCEKSSG
jgi:hypothetical protein